MPLLLPEVEYFLLPSVAELEECYWHLLHHRYGRHSPGGCDKSFLNFFPLPPASPSHMYCLANPIWSPPLWSTSDGLLMPSGSLAPLECLKYWIITLGLKLYTIMSSLHIIQADENGEIYLQLWHTLPARSSHRKVAPPQVCCLSFHTYTFT